MVTDELGSGRLCEVEEERLEDADDVCPTESVLEILEISEIIPERGDNMGVHGSGRHPSSGDDGDEDDVDMVAVLVTELSSFGSGVTRAFRDCRKTV